LGFEMALLRMLAFQPAGATQLAAGGTSPASAPVAAAAKQPARQTAAGGKPKVAKAAAAAASLPADLDWPAMIDALDFKGVMRQLAQNCQLVARTETAMQLNVGKASAHLLTAQQKERMTKTLRGAYGEALQVTFAEVDDVDDTVALQEANESALKLRAARDSIHSDPELQEIVDVFGAEIESDAIRPVDSGGNGS